MTKKSKNKLLIALSAVGPGLFLIGYNIGTGSVITMAKTGAEHGMKLFWALVLSCIFTFILMIAYGKVTLVSGRTALSNFRSEFKYGWILALYILVALIIGELLALIGIMGLMADLIHEALSLILGNPDINRNWIVLVITIGIFIILWIGQYKTFEKILTVFVIFMGISFIVVFFMVKPDFLTIVKGLIPGIPDLPGAFGMTAAIAGTTCSAAVFIMRSTVVAEKGWSINHLKTEKKDALVSASMMLLLSGTIMAVGAGTLHILGLKVENTLDLIHLFEPLGGKFAALILILGIVGAGLSTVFPIVLIAPWLVADYTGTSRNIHSATSRGLIFFAMLIALGSIFIKQAPPSIIIYSLIFQACILPAVAIPILILINRRKLMGNHKAGIRENIGLWSVVLFSLLATWFAIKEVFI